MAFFIRAMGRFAALACCCLSVVLGGHSIAWTQDAPLDLALINGQLAELDELDGLPEEDRIEASELLIEAREELTEALERTETVDGFVEAAANSIETSTQIRQNITILTEAQGPADIPETSIDLRNRVDTLQSDLALKNQRFVDLEDERTALAERASEIAEESAVSRATLDDLLEAQGTDGNAASVVDRARQTLLRARIFARRSGITDLQRELTSLPERQTINLARIALVEAEMATLDRELSIIQQRLSDVRMGQADAALTEAIDNRNAAADVSTSDQAIAEENIQLATALRDMADDALIIEQDVRTFSQQTLLIRQQAETVTRILATGRVTEEAGTLLRQLRSSLPNAQGLRNSIGETVEQRGSLQLNLILWQDRLRSTRQIDSSALIAGPDLEGAEPIDVDDLRRALSENLRSHRERLLISLIRSGQAQSDRLNEKEIRLSEALREAQTLRNTLDRRLLWLPSNVRPLTNWLGNVVSSVQWASSPAVRQDIWSDYTRSLRNMPLVPVSLGLFAMLLLVNRERLRTTVADLNGAVGKVARDKYLTTPSAVMACLALALPVPILLLSVFLPGIRSLSQSEIVGALALGGLALALIILIAFFIRTISEDAGVLATHFNWEKGALKTVRSVPSSFVIGLAIAVCLVVVSIASGRPDVEHGIGMVAFVIASVCIAALGYRAFEPGRGLVTQVITEGLSGSFVLLGLLALGMAPLAIGLLPIFGYFDTAVALQVRVLASAALLFLGAIIFGILRRDFLIAQRRLALRKAIERREQMAAERDEQDREDEGDDELPEPLSAVEDLEKQRQMISNQTRRFLLYVFAAGGLIGLFAVWATVLPALGVANDVVLWTGVDTIDGVQTARPITLWNLILFVVLLVAGFVAAYNIGGLLEVGPFQLLNLSPGSRYAIRTIISYCFVGAGIIAGFLQLGVDWSRLQWIIAALGVGLGFGLQEIVANFISGLIILFERPVRVGDTVNIGELEGDVTNISIRATTIRDFDNREVLLPNKSIITENVTNWTLRDSIVRIIIDIGVAYGSDIEKVRQILLRIAEEENDVLDTPEPRAFFMSHGDSSLDFELRVFISNPRKRFRVRDELNTAINSAFREASIEVPFPQRDLHIKQS
ncbi:MAG: mechanosensitive ion channel domain-containing protein [Pseudomonadota bacterium]